MYPNGKSIVCYCMYIEKTFVYVIEFMKLLLINNDQWVFKFKQALIIPAAASIGTRIPLKRWKEAYTYTGAFVRLFVIITH